MACAIAKPERGVWGLAPVIMGSPDSLILHNEKGRDDSQAPRPTEGGCGGKVEISFAANEKRRRDAALFHLWRIRESNP